MSDYIECLDCGFVTYSESGSAAKPERWDTCPGCGGTEFAFTDESADSDDE